MEWLLFPMVFIFMGFRHGLDSDHVAAIADMVGVETQKRKQIGMGVMYALGHGMIVLVIGLIAVVAGSHLPDKLLQGMEMLVGVSLLVLGVAILYSIVKQRHNYQYVGRFELIYRSVRALFRKGTKEKADVTKIGIIGAFVIGIIHGIGAETPTQVALISTTVGLNNVLAASIQIVLFTLGLLLATTGITFLASWGFMKARFTRKAYIVLGCLTGGYSMVLGWMIIQGV
jgi:high-affinity nickel permease